MPIFLRTILIEYGLWDQVRVDQGKEWILSLFVQEHLAHLRRDTSKPLHRQTMHVKIGMPERYRSSLYMTFSEIVSA
jgi:hypothetical protein